MGLHLQGHMIAPLHLILSTIASAGIVGLGDQYLTLFMVGMAVRFGSVTVPQSLSFLGAYWFLAAAALGWLMTVPPSALPASISPFIGWITNAISGPVTLISGAVVALASAGMISSVQPEFGASMYLLGRDPNWANLAAYGATDWSVLAGGSVFAAGLTFGKFVAKPGIAVLTGTALTGSAPMFAVSENIVTLILAPLALWLQHINPVLLVAMMLLLSCSMAALVFLAMKAAIKAGTGAIGAMAQLLDSDPAGGLAVISEAVLWGSGWLLMGHWGRGVVMLVVWGLAVLIGATGLGLPVAVVSYFIVAPRTARALYRRVTRDRIIIRLQPLP